MNHQKVKILAAKEDTMQLYVYLQKQRAPINATPFCDGQILFDIDVNGKLQGVEILLTDKEIIKQITEAIK